jgi:hypothetical protein
MWYVTELKLIRQVFKSKWRILKTSDRVLTARSLQEIHKSSAQWGGPSHFIPD